MSNEITYTIIQASDVPANERFEVRGRDAGQIV